MPDAEAILAALRVEYSRVTDGVKRITRAYKPKSDLLTSPAEVKIIEAYELLLKSEETHGKIVEMELDRYPIWTQYLKDVRGCGPLMAGVILSEIDIEKCNSISALWAYCGLDVVVHTNPETGEVLEEGRSRKKHHLKAKTYTNRNGETVDTVGITFNPFLKTKLVGVLGSVFIKLGGPYRTIYDGYKHRLENHPKWVDRTKAHRHNAAVRYMVKEFLADLWTTWRTIEGLPVRDRYSEGKLGIIHSNKKAA